MTLRAIGPLLCGGILVLAMGTSTLAQSSGGSAKGGSAPKIHKQGQVALIRGKVEKTDGGHRIFDRWGNLTNKKTGNQSLRVRR